MLFLRCFNNNISLQQIQITCKVIKNTRQLWGFKTKSIPLYYIKIKSTMGTQYAEYVYITIKWFSGYNINIQKQEKYKKIYELHANDLVKLDEMINS